MNTQNFIHTVDFNQDYNKFIEYLFSLKDDEYKKFNQKIVKTDNIIGIRLPILKNIAKIIAKNDYLSFIKNNKHQYSEEIMLHGLVITYLKIDFNESIKLFDEYIKYIDSWATCDSVVMNYKVVSKNLDICLIKIKEYLKSDKPFVKRVGIVLLFYYLNDNYIDEVLKLINSIKLDDYYVKMANAWLISICLVKYYDKTVKFLKSCQLDDWTYNKALQKAIESYRIKDKETLRKMKF